MAGNGVLIVGEAGAAGLRSISLEQVTAANAIASAFGGSVTGLLMGSGIGDAASQFAGAIGGKVLVADDPRLAQLTAEAATTVVVSAIAATDPAVVLFPNTTIGAEYAPRAAARMKVGLAADCIALRADGGTVVATRPVLGGRMQADVTLNASAVQLVTIRAGSFEKTAAAAGGSVEAFPVALTDADTRVTVSGIAAKESSGVGLDTAEIIVGGGRGLKEASNFALIESLAGAMGGAVAATRAVTDVGWRPHSEQIGQTGKVVSPKLYVAVGISGAVQHMVGIQGAEQIIAINRDPDAPIFKTAAFGIVGDLFEVVPALTTEIAAAKG